MMQSAFSLLALVAISPCLGSALAARTSDPITEDDRVTELVQRGRELIARGKGVEARAVLEEADALSDGKLLTRMWLARALVEMNYLNDALDMIDELAATGKAEVETNYLYGMAFTYKARKYIAEGLQGNMIAMHFTDSVNHLTTATQADPELYSDAFLPLAEAAWNSQMLGIARAAADKAVEVSSGGAPELFMRAEVAFSQFVVANGDETRMQEADDHWQVAFDSFQAASIRDVESGDPSLVWRVANAHKKSGDALVWKSRLPDAAEQYAIAMGHYPGMLAFDQVLSSLGKEQFLVALENGSADFSRRHEPTDDNDATLLWWLGWARFDNDDFDRARAAFELSFEKWPDFTNCKWYIALCKYHTQDPDGAIEDILENIQLDIGGLVGSVQGNLVLNLAIIDSLVGHSFQENRPLDAARLSAVQANASPDTTRYWNNMGLFYRDAGSNLRGGTDEDESELRQQYYEKALEGYERALALEPQNPALLNDTAVVLHYNLERDLERAKQMYLLSNERALIELARTDLGEDLQRLYSIAKRDSTNNLVALERLLRRRAKRAAEEAEAGDQGDPTEKPQDG